MLVSGNNALADNFTKLIPEHIGVIGKISLQPPILAVGKLNLRVKSIKNSSSQAGKIIINIQETGQTVGPIAIDPGQVLPITLNTCFSNLVNVKFADINKPYQSQKTISSANATTTPPPIHYGLYDMTYEISAQGCP
ncbi:hypothetical protein LC593_20565 [Nostoc sp. CHAB 5844]|nr:hypothetical protein [Nostoc sp. CHAB 5844]